MREALIHKLYWVAAQIALYGWLAPLGFRGASNMPRYLRFQRWWNGRPFD